MDDEICTRCSMPRSQHLLVIGYRPDSESAFRICPGATFSTTEKWPPRDRNLSKEDFDKIAKSVNESVKIYAEHVLPRTEAQALNLINHVIQNSVEREIENRIREVVKAHVKLTFKETL